MKYHKPCSKKSWYGKKYGIIRSKKKKKAFVLTMHPIKSGWMRYPLVSRAIAWNVFYYTTNGERKRTVEKNSQALLFFSSDYPEEISYFGASGKEASALDLNNFEELKKYVTMQETTYGVDFSKSDLSSKTEKDRKNIHIRFFSPSPQFPIQEYPITVNEVLCRSESTITKKIWHWDTTNILSLGGQLIAVIKEEKKGDDTDSLYVFISPYGRRLKDEAFQSISLCTDTALSERKIFKVKKLNNSFGYLNEKLEYIFPLEFDYASVFSEGYAVASTLDNIWVLSEDGTAIPVKESVNSPIVNGGRFKEGVAKVSILYVTMENIAYFESDLYNLGCWFYINTEGKLITKPKYIIAHDMRDGLALVCKGKWYKDPKWDNEYRRDCYWSDKMLWGAIDKNGKEIIPCRFDALAYLDDETKYLSACVYNDDGEECWGIIDRTGKWVVAPLWKFRPEALTENLIVFKSYKKKRPCGLYDILKKKVILKDIYDYIWLEKNSTFIKAETLTGRIYFFELIEGVVNITDGKNYDWTMQYYDVDICKNGYLVQLTNYYSHLYGIVDFQGNSILPCIFPAISVDNKRLVFEKKGRCGLMDFDENILIPPLYDKITINKDEYDEIYNPFPGMVEVSKGKYIGLFTINGVEIIPPKYISLDFAQEGMYLCNTVHGYDMVKVENITKNNA